MSTTSFDIQSLVLKHMPGKHDQSTHGRKKRSGSAGKGQSLDKMPGGWSSRRPNAPGKIRFVIGRDGAAFAGYKDKVNKKATDMAGPNAVSGMFIPKDHPNRKFDHDYVELSSGRPSREQVDRILDAFPEVEVLTGKGFKPMWARKQEKPKAEKSSGDKWLTRAPGKKPPEYANKLHGFSLGKDPDDGSDVIGFVPGGTFNTTNRGNMKRAREDQGLDHDEDVFLAEYDPVRKQLILGAFEDSGGLRPKLSDSQLSLIAGEYPELPDMTVWDYDRPHYYDRQGDTFVPAVPIKAEALERARAEMDELFGPSRWKGVLNTDVSKGADGTKKWECTIAIERDTQRSRDAGHVAVHELFHSYSDNESPLDERKRNYVKNKGWEEGMVESLTRLYGPELYKTMAPEGSKSDAWDSYSQGAKKEKNHPYEGYVDAMEDIRTELRMDPTDFYGALLEVSPDKRKERVREMGKKEWPKFNSKRRRAFEDLVNGKDQILRLFSPDIAKREQEIDRARRYAEKRRKEEMERVIAEQREDIWGPKWLKKIL